MRRQRKALIRIRKEINLTRDTHELETEERGTYQNTERNRPSKGYSPPGDGRERDFVRTRKKTDRARGTYSLETVEGRDLSGHEKKPTKRRALTNWRRQRKGLVRTQKETDRARGTHKLETVEGGTCKSTERTRLSEGDSLPGYSRGKYLSGHGKKSTE